MDDGREEVLREGLDGVRVLDFRHDDRELVAAESRDRSRRPHPQRRGIGGRDAVLEPPRDHPEHLVARPVAQGVVDLLEAVEIDVEESDGRSLPSGVREGLLEAFDEEAPIGEAREAVVVRELDQVLLVSPPLAHVSQDERAGLGRALQRVRRAEPDLVHAIRTLAQREVVRIPAPHERLHALGQLRLARRTSRLGVDRPRCDLVEGLATPRVRIDQPAGRVDEDEAVPRGLDGRVPSDVREMGRAAAAERHAVERRGEQAEDLDREPEAVGLRPFRDQQPGHEDREHRRRLVAGPTTPLATEQHHDEQGADRRRQVRPSGREGIPEKGQLRMARQRDQRERHQRHGAARENGQAALTEQARHHARRGRAFAVESEPHRQGTHERAQRDHQRDLLNLVHRTPLRRSMTGARSG